MNSLFFCQGLFHQQKGGVRYITRRLFENVLLTELHTVKISIQTPVLDRFTEVLRTDRFNACKICNRARNLQNSVICSRREPQLVHRHLQEFRSGFIYLAKLFDLLRLHVCICEQPLPPLKPAGLNVARNDHTLPNRFREFSALLSFRNPSFADCANLHNSAICCGYKICCLNCTCVCGGFPKRGGEIPPRHRLPYARGGEHDC